MNLTAILELPAAVSLETLQDCDPGRAQQLRVPIRKLLITFMFQKNQKPRCWGQR